MGGNWAGALLVLMLTTITFSSLGVISAAFTMVFKRGDPVHLFVGGISFLLGGVIFPVSEMPGWLQAVARLLPITHGLDGMRALLLQGRPLGAVGTQLLILTLFVALSLPLSLLCFQKAVNIARRDGTLLHY
jgi:ABC-2 type transport system permease protein